ncbi:hypothetical protein NTE_03189 [Candidatus Nitrososphaera evergladensis SR1]|uniref:Uncharacterized protein n=1 Tax=Candidatus Nitrososphaera evergladensis SR1 TaxID=1459636 RepID=A0A075MVN5_9ARCH|nr:hypothetical protein [Candidatus Nitrososphaera evergladensis]AIF85218.1 hypothetical protein NTE_03189 [Candidatus Nitrososphaera evergladensis SR1]
MKTQDAREQDLQPKIEYAKNALWTCSDMKNVEKASVYRDLEKAAKMLQLLHDYDGAKRILENYTSVIVNCRVASYFDSASTENETVTPPLFPGNPDVFGPPNGGGGTSEGSSSLIFLIPLAATAVFGALWYTTRKK